MKHAAAFALPAALLIASACAAEPEAGRSAGAATPTLSPLWVADGFSAPEGAAMAPDGTFFISNVAGEASDKDGEGWISKISETGAVIDRRFAQGLDAPKGMIVHDGVLFATDIDRVRMIDAASGENLGDIPIDGAKFLNDATVWNGAVYVSDSADAAIHKIVDGDAALWLRDDRLGGVNGLLPEGEALLISTMRSGSLLRAGADGGLSEIATGMENADGIGVVPGGGWLVSAWPGEIFYVAPDGARVSLVNTRDTDTTQNDLSVFGDLVIVPNWRANTVTAWRLSR